MEINLHSSSELPASFLVSVLYYLLPLGLLAKMLFIYKRRTSKIENSLSCDFLLPFINETVLVQLVSPAFMAHGVCGLYALIDGQWTRTMWFLYALSNGVMALFHFYHNFSRPYVREAAIASYSIFTFLLHHLMIEISFSHDQTSKELLLNLFGSIQGCTLSFSVFFLVMDISLRFDLKFTFTLLLTVITETIALYLLVQNLKSDLVLWSELIGLISISVIGMIGSAMMVVYKFFHIRF